MVTKGTMEDAHPRCLKCSYALTNAWRAPKNMGQ